MGVWSLAVIFKRIADCVFFCTGEESGDVAGEADSGEDSEEEWNYISGKENRQPNQQQKEVLLFLPVSVKINYRLKKMYLLIL